MDGLQQCQQDLALRLRSVSALAGVMVQDLRPRSEEEALLIQNTINLALAGMISDTPRKGIAILVPVPGFEVSRRESPAPYGEIVITAQVLEQVAINEGPDGTGMSCEAVAIEILRAGHQYLLRPNMMLFAKELRQLEVDPDQGWKADFALEVEFRVMGGFDALPQCPIPNIKIEEEQVVISCADPDAVCLVTLDGSLPCAANASAVAYDGAFAVPPSGTLIRACATKPGLEDSGVNALFVP